MVLYFVCLITSSQIQFWIENHLTLKLTMSGISKLYLSKAFKKTDFFKKKQNLPLSGIFLL